MNKIDFGKYLHWMRKESNMTQEQLSGEIGCATPTISKWEKGHEFPCLSMFKKLNRVFEEMGLVYDELTMENIFCFKKARKELLVAIKKGRRAEIEKKVDILEKILNDENIEVDKEDKQYILLAHLISTRKSGMSVEDFLDEVGKIYEFCRNLPKYHDIPVVKLTEIEYEILMMIAEAHISKGDNETAELIFKGLMANRIDERSPFRKERYLEVSSQLARICLMKRDYKSMNDCLRYVFNDFLDRTDFRMIFKTLYLHGELCVSVGDEIGKELVNDFIRAARRLTKYMFRKYGIRRDIGSSLL